ncbi:adhesin biosynthesis transcription regulatory family protein [Salmonella enterica subsp. arizonae]|nr:major pilu subunit operon regulatory protein PapB [Salmonella enterica subsp. arizonae]SUG40542.1 major pilu subunit operon regulatory protein PapB [Salmonella enterica subsp. arizonae]SUH63770.1 major pilu subunit operon regulatory protein PapB [Salmonella enterica subsp. arizonae]
MMLHESKENFPEEPQGFYQQGELIPGSVDIRHFRLLMTISSVNNEKMYKALEEVLVYGKSRKEACENNAVTQSYFSVKYRNTQMVSHAVYRIMQFMLTDK